MNVADVLRGAASEIEKRGLHKGGLLHPPVGIREARQSPTVKCCAMGAIVLAEGDPDGMSWAATMFFEDFVGSFVGEWNDAPERTQEEVVDTLRAAADQWEAENDVA